jgi:transketolase
VGEQDPRPPEYGLTPGVETTTGPLGQGFANGVGMAMAEAHLTARFNTPEHAPIDHHVYAICSDGDLMEGVASEAASIAGHLGLGKLIYFWDDNKITIEGSTELAFTEDVLARFAATAGTPSGSTTSTTWRRSTRPSAAPRPTRARR